jgi:hypothetical protein
MAIGEVLVSIDHASGTAAVVRYEEKPGLWLVGSVVNPMGGGVRGHRPITQGLPGSTTAYGGRLPPGAATATVIDSAGMEHAATTGRGAWIAIVPEDAIVAGERPVRYAATDGSLVAPQLPNDWRRTPRIERGSVCPVCDASEWDEITPAVDPSVIQPDGKPYQERPFSACRKCGHEDHVLRYP